MHLPTVTIPREVTRVTSALEAAGFEAYLIGGCVRDLLLGKEPKDWDVTTDATPDEILEVFKHAHYDNEFGTVRVINDQTDIDTLKVIEVTTYRTEMSYSDNRRPDAVSFSTNLSDDLRRRDFTVNALALSVPRDTKRTEGGVKFDVTRDTLVDEHGGIDDLENRIIRTVGDPHNRFDEDALRILRAIRFSAEHNFEIENQTKKAIQKHAKRLSSIAVERIREEFLRIIDSPHPKRALETAQDLGVLAQFMPELEDGVGVEQNQAHDFTVWEHLLRSLQAAADKGFPTHVRLAALFHDIGKPQSRRYSKDTQDYTFYGHEVVGARITREILNRLKFPHDLRDDVVTLVRWHMFFSDPDEITLSAVRRLLRRVGKDLIWDLMDLRVCDRIGTGRPKEEPYRLRKYYSMIEEVIRDPISVKMLAIDGNDLMDELSLEPGPQIGHILHALLEEVLDDPDKNTREHLLKRAEALTKLPEEELRTRGEHGKETREEEEQKAIKAIRDKYYVE